MAQTIEFDTAIADQLQQTVLLGTAYKLRFQYNNRGSFWSMDISTQDDQLLVAGTKLTMRNELLTRFKDARLPDGVLIASDLDNNPATPVRNDFGNRVALVLLSDAEVQQAIAEAA